MSAPLPPKRRAECLTGTSWYGWGQHFRVVAETTRDGEPAVSCRYTNSKGGFTVITEKLLRHAERTDT